MTVVVTSKELLLAEGGTKCMEKKKKLSWAGGELSNDRTFQRSYHLLLYSPYIQIQASDLPIRHPSTWLECVRGRERERERERG
jgi:hypothetical protein